MKSYNWYKEECSGREVTYSYEPCIHKSLSEVVGIESHYKGIEILKDCAVLSEDKSSCETCIEGYSKSGDICCKHNEINVNL